MLAIILLSFFFNHLPTLAVILLWTFTTILIQLVINKPYIPTINYIHHNIVNDSPISEFFDVIPTPVQTSTML